MSRIAYLIASSFFASAFLAAEHPACNHQRSAFHYSKELGLSGQLRIVEDIVILKDGTLLQGEIGELPVLKFPLGKIHLPVEQVEAFISDKGGLFKLRTRKNELYIGNVEQRHLFFKGSRTVIDLGEVDVVLFKPRDLVDSLSDQMLAVGEDFDLNALNEIPDDLDEENEIEFISLSKEVKPVDEAKGLLALRRCQKCSLKPAPDRVPYIDFPIKDAPEEEEKEGVIEVPELQDPPENPVVRVNACKIQTESVPRVYDGLVYVDAARVGETGFYIRPKKVTNREYKQFVDAINYRTPIHWLGGAIPSGMEDDPVVNVTYRDAFLYSVWAGKRLPSQEDLSIATELNVILTDKGDQSAEWTATPTMQSVKSPQSSDSVKIGQSFFPSHEVFSRNRIISMNNDDANSCTGFRTALDAH